jgi:hypothetical protein
MDKLKNGKLNISKLKILISKIAIPVLIILTLVIFSFLLFEGSKLVWIWGKDKLTLAAQNEQVEHKDKLCALITSIENQADSLETEYKNLFSKNRIELEKKKEILEKLEELEKNGLQLTILFNSYRQDESIKINPLRNLNTEEIFNKSWLLPHKIERLARSLEFGIFRGFITVEQGIIIEKDFSGVRYQIDEIKKTWI